MKKSNSIIYMAIALILVVIVAALVVNAYARYAKQYQGTATINAANWSFAAGDITTTPITLTATETNNLAFGKIAPGTSGTFDINLDGKGSETAIKYTISLEIPPEAPNGLTLKYDGKTTAKIEGYIEYKDTTTDETAMKKTITVNWEWAIGEDVNTVNGIDNGYAGKEYTVNVIVRGEQHIGTISTT